MPPNESHWAGMRMDDLYARADSPGAAVRYQEVLDETRQLMPIFRQRVPETNNLRQLPSATCDDIRRSGMAHVLQPARYGGVETISNRWWTC